MVLTMWIVKEPDSNLRLSIDRIDPQKLDFEDVSWICSSVMKQYRDEFNALPGFIDRAAYLVQRNRYRLPKKKKNNVYSEVVKGYKAPTPRTTIEPEGYPPPINDKVNDTRAPYPIYNNHYPKTPTICPANPEQFIEINTKKSIPFNKIPFIKKPRFKRNKPDVNNSEACILN